MRPRHLLCACAFLTAASAFAHGQNGADLEVTIHVHDYAGTDPGQLAAAETFAGRIFSLAGIRARWSNCRLPWLPDASPGGCAGSAAGGTHLVFRILPESKARKLHAPPKRLGMSLLTANGTFPADAYIFADRAGQLAERGRCPVAVVLGAAIAHETGHLLLQAEDHTVTGIMRAQWGPREINDALMGVLTFSREQSGRMRSGVERRTRVAGAAEIPDSVKSSAYVSR